MTDEEKLKSVLSGAVDVPVVHRHDTGQGETFVTFYPLEDEITLYGSNGALRYVSNWCVVISSRGPYDAIKLAIYQACCAAGMRIASTGPESEKNTETDYYTWPIDVSIMVLINRGQDARE